MTTELPPYPALNPDGSFQSDVVRAHVVEEGSAFSDIAKWPGVDNTGTLECAVAIQVALDGIKARGERAYAKGIFRVASQVQFSSHADFSEATFNYYGPAGVACLVGRRDGGNSQAIHFITVSLPHLYDKNKTLVGDGWSEVGGDIGVEIANLYTSTVTIPLVRNFGKGVRLGAYASGVSYNHIHLGHLWNNKVNMHFESDATGWANQNNFYLGRFMHNGGERIDGGIVPGCKHILMVRTPHMVNGNNFWGTSFEGGDTAEYFLDVAGYENAWNDCRWENAGADAAVIWREGGDGNIIKDGYDAHRITETFEAGSGAHNLLSRGGNRVSSTSGLSGNKSVYTLRNTTNSAHASLRIMPAEAGDSNNEHTEWVWEHSASQIRGKQKTDAFPRIIIDAITGRILFGPGTTEPVASIGAQNANFNISGPTTFTPNNTHDFGHTSLRPRDVWVGRQVVTPAVKLESAGALPLATSGRRGETRVVHNATGVADSMVVCVKNAADTYEWAPVNLTFAA